MGIWIDERGRVVRPAEPAWTTNQSMKFGGKSIATEGELYVAALRDWVKNGERSAYALSDEEFARRVKPAFAGRDGGRRELQTGGLVPRERRTTNWRRNTSRAPSN